MRGCAFQSALQHLFGQDDVPEAGLYLVNQLITAELVAYSGSATNGLFGLTGRFWDSQLIPGAAGVAEYRAMVATLDTLNTNAPMDGFAQMCRRLFADVFKMKIEKFVLALLRTDMEVDGQAGYFRWCRHARP